MRVSILCNCTCLQISRNDFMELFVCFEIVLQTGRRTKYSNRASAFAWFENSVPFPFVHPDFDGTLAMCKEL